MRRVWKVLEGQRRQFVLLVGAIALVGGLEAAVHPLLLKLIFDEAVLRASYGRFVALGLSYLGFGVVVNGAQYVLSLARKRFENATIERLEVDLSERALDLDTRELVGNGAASYLGRIHQDAIEGLLPGIDLVIQVTRQAVMAVVFVGVLIWLSWLATVLLLILVPPLLLFSHRVARRLAANTDTEREAEAQYLRSLTALIEAHGALRGMRRLRSLAVEANRRVLARYLDVNYRNQRLVVKQQTASDLTMNVSDTVSMIACGYLVLAGRLTFGGFLAFVNSFWRGVSAVLFLIGAIPELGRNGAVLDRIAALRDRPAPRPYHQASPTIDVEGLVLSYGSATTGPFDMVVHPGEHVVVRGVNGTGKTSLIRSIAGHLEPTHGRVARPEAVAVLSAPVHLPQLPVAELAPDPTVRAAFRLTGLEGALPEHLSSGQKQALALASLLSQPADAYVLDEPFANLDDEATRRACRQVLARCADTTLVVVLHGMPDMDSLFDRTQWLVPGSLAATVGS